jgi:hypothetical protein
MGGEPQMAINVKMYYAEIAYRVFKLALSQSFRYRDAHFEYGKELTSTPKVNPDP